MSRNLLGPDGWSAGLLDPNTYPRSDVQFAPCLCFLRRSSGKCPYFILSWVPLKGMCGIAEKFQIRKEISFPYPHTRFQARTKREVNSNNIYTLKLVKGV